MKRISIFPQQEDVVDVPDLRAPMRRTWFRSPRILGALALSLLIVAATSSWTYAVYLKTLRDQQRVDAAEAVLSASSTFSDFYRNMHNWPTEKRLITLAEMFLDKDSGVPTDLGISASRAALDLAIHQGSKEARLALGKSMRDGELGEKDQRAALAQFQLVHKELQPGILAGDQDALYVYSLMLREGLGVEHDPAKARLILKRVALSRDFMTMQRIAQAALWLGEERDLDLVKAISEKLIASGHPESYYLGTSACSQEYAEPSGEFEQISEMVDKGNYSGVGPFAAKKKLRKIQLNHCKLSFLQAAADKGEKDAIETLASLTSKIAPPALREQPSPVVYVQAVDPEVQSRTGYINGTKQLAKGGLSTFKVDNTKGGGDAVVRLYRDGKKPSARSMFVKNGESFTAAAVAPGAYRLRYRYIGSADTFEAEDTFALTETSTETGTRFSRVTVTFYKVANGNMTVKKVDASEF